MSGNDAKHDPAKDIAALAAYAPRREAIRLIIEGHIDDYLKWARGDGFVAARGTTMEKRGASVDLESEIPLDGALRTRIWRSADGIEGALEQIQHEQEFVGIASEAIPYFGASPLEIALRSGNFAGIECVVRYLTSPKMTFARGYHGTRGGGWKTLYSGLRRASSTEAGVKLQVDFSKPDTPLILLAVLLGDLRSANLMLQLGWAPEGEWAYGDLCSSVSRIQQEIKKDPAFEDVVTAAFDIPRGTTGAATNWLLKRANLSQELEDLFDEADYAAIREKVMKLLVQGTHVGYYPLSVATENNDLEMLRRLFAAGANPNCRYKTGVAMLARIDAKRLTPEALQIWLDAGANPTHGMDSDTPFGDGLNPSALSAWAWNGRRDLIEQAVEKAVSPVPLSYQYEGNTYAPLLATALSQGHLDLAFWLVSKKGLSLDALDDGNGEACRDFATPEFLAQAEAAVAGESQT